jgi:hypothetical protein
LSKFFLFGTLDTISRILLRKRNGYFPKKYELRKKGVTIMNQKELIIMGIALEGLLDAEQYETIRKMADAMKSGKAQDNDPPWDKEEG